MPENHARDGAENIPPFEPGEIVRIQDWVRWRVLSRTIDGGVVLERALPQSGFNRSIIMPETDLCRVASGSPAPSALPAAPPELVGLQVRHVGFPGLLQVLSVDGEAVTCASADDDLAKPVVLPFSELAFVPPPASPEPMAAAAAPDETATALREALFWLWAAADKQRDYTSRDTRIDEIQINGETRAVSRILADAKTVMGAWAFDDIIADPPPERLHAAQTVFTVGDRVVIKGLGASLVMTVDDQPWSVGGKIRCSWVGPDGASRQEWFDPIVLEHVSADPAEPALAARPFMPGDTVRPRACPGCQIMTVDDAPPAPDGTIRCSWPGVAGVLWGRFIPGGLEHVSAVPPEANGAPCSNPALAPEPDSPPAGLDTVNRRMDEITARMATDDAPAATAPKPTFAVGDAVRLKGDGPIMTVTVPSLFNSAVECAWFDGHTRLIKDRFLAQTLEHVPVVTRERVGGAEDFGTTLDDGSQSDAVAALEGNTWTRCLGFGPATRRTTPTSARCRCYASTLTACCVSGTRPTARRTRACSMTPRSGN